MIQTQLKKINTSLSEITECFKNITQPEQNTLEASIKNYIGDTKSGTKEIVTTFPM
jgi:hypothetical protein